MRDYPLSIAPGDSFRLNVSGSFIRVKSSSAELIYSHNSNRLALSQGDKVRFPDSFGSIEILNENAGTVTAVLTVGTGDADASSVIGEVNISRGANIVNSTVNVALTKTLLVASNTSRRSVIIQNLDASQTVAIGASANVETDGLEIGAGGSLTLDHAPEAAIYAASYGSTAISVRILEELN